MTTIAKSKCLQSYNLHAVKKNAVVEIFLGGGDREVLVVRSDVQLAYLVASGSPGRQLV